MLEIPSVMFDAISELAQENELGRFLHRAPQFSCNFCIILLLFFSTGQQINTVLLSDLLIFMPISFKNPTKFQLILTLNKIYVNQLGFLNANVDKPS